MKQSIHSMQLNVKANYDFQIKSLKDATDAFDKEVLCGTLNTIEIHPDILPELKAYLDALPGVSSISSGVQGGCYGARDGNMYDGLTVWVDVECLPERTVETHSDGSQSEYYNPVLLIQEYGGELIDDIEDVDAWLETIEALGLEIRHDNTYNSNGCSDSPSAMYEVDFKLVEGPKCVYLAASFHYGGDIRGNYGSAKLFKFDSIDDVYGALCPTSHLEEEAS